MKAQKRPQTVGATCGKDKNQGKGQFRNTSRACQHNSNLAGKIATVDLVAVAEASGVKLKKHGDGHWGRCPFHPDKNPSFTVRQHGQKWRFRCWGCGANGDAVDYIRIAYKLDFRGALAFLGVEPSPRTPELSRAVRRNQRRAELAESFWKWVDRQVDIACFIIHVCNRHVQKIHGPDDLETYGMFFHIMAVAEYRHQWLCDADDEALFSLFREGGFYA